MASRVNVRFVVFLAIGLIVLAGGVMVAGVYALRKNGAEYAALGEKKLQEAAGEVDKQKKAKAIEQASVFYSRAVFREPTNPEFCRKWREALGKLTPSPQQAYIDTFKQDYTGAWVGLRNSAPQDVAVQREYLDWTLERIEKFSPTSVEAWQNLAEEAKDSIGAFDDAAQAAALQRYVAIANVAVIRSQGVGLSGTLMEPTRQAIEASLKADPADAQAVNAKASLMVLEASELRAKDPAAADRLGQEARDMLVAFVQQHPDEVRVRLTLLQLEMNRAVIEAKNTLTWGQLYVNFHDKMQELMDAVKRAKPEVFDSATAVATAGMAMSSPRIGPEGTISFLDELLKAHPTNATLLIAKGRAAMQANNVEEAIKAYQLAADLPDLPLSLDGVYLFGQRAEAMVQQVTAKIATITPDMSAADRAKLIAEAQSLRQRLVDYTGEGETAILLLDARLLLAENKSAAARIKLDEFNQKTDNKNVEGLALQGDLQAMMRNLGGAKTQYENVLKREPTNLRALFQMVQVERQLKNYAGAIARCDELLALQPNNEVIADIRKTLVNIQAAKDSTDPVIRILAEVEELVTGVNREHTAAAAKLRDGITKQKDVRLHRALVQVLSGANDRAGALEAANNGLAAFADDATLKQFVSGLSETDPLAARLAQVEANTSLDEVTRLVTRSLVFRQFGKTEEAKAELAKAAALKPDAPGVIELQFGDAVRDGKMEEAKKLSESAARMNADNVGGLTFRARLEMAEKRYAEAATTLDETLVKDKLNVTAWRLLGAVRAQLGQLDAADTAFEKALEIKPDDMESVVGSLRVKIAQRAYASALTFARAKQGVAGGEPDFVDLWLLAESVAPAGDKNRAIEVRRKQRERLPENEQNNYALAVLLIDARDWDSARKLIDELRSKDALNARYLEVDAHWNLAQGNARAAAEKFNQYITSLPADKHTEEPYVALAALLMRYGQSEAALVTLRDGAKHQDPKVMRADRELAEAYYSLGQFDKAIEVFDKIAATKPTDLVMVESRVLSSLVRSGRLRDAKAKIDAKGEAEVANNASMLVVRADVLAGLGDREGALKSYDQAVSVDKSSAYAFVKRGDFLMGDRAREKDAEDDLKQAILIDPKSYIARQRLAVLHMRRDRFDDAAKVLKEGLALDPDNSSLRQDLIDVYVLAKQPEKVVVEIEQAVQRAPTDSGWLLRARDTMARLEKWDAAAEYGARLWERNKFPTTASGYIDALLKSSKPDLTKAIAVLATPELNTAKDVRLLIVRSRVQLKRGKVTEATQDLATALSMVDQTKAAQVGIFYTGLATIYPQVKDQLAALKALEPKSGYKSWFAVWHNKLKGDAPESMAEGLAALKQIGEGGESTDVRVAAYAAIGSRLHSDKKHDEALAAWRSGLQVDPNDAEMNNNVAFTLATVLNRPAEAVVYAEKAALALPDNPSVLDTLGAVHLGLKNYDKAEQALVQAQAYASSESERTAIFLHLSKLRAAQGNRVEAQKFVEYAREIIRQSEEVRARFAEEFEKIKAEVAAMG